MERKELLESREYWISKIQNELYAIIESYMVEKKLKRSQLAEKLNVTKGYISQVLNGDFDHKISKLVDLALASGKAPVLYFLDLEKYIEHDAKNQTYHILPISEGKTVDFISKSIKVDLDLPINIKPLTAGATYSELKAFSTLITQ